MPTYEVSLPTGETYQVESPNELTDQQAHQYALQQKAPQQEKFESPGFVANLKDEFKGGLRQAFNPSKTEYLGSESLSDLPVVGDSVRNAIGSLMGISRSVYSIPGAAAKTYVGDPLRERGYDKAAGYAEGAAGLGLSMLGGGVPFLGKAMGLLGAKAPAVLDKGLAASSRLPLRIAGKALDPLASTSPRMLEKATSSLEGRIGKIADIEGRVAKANEGIEGLQSTLRPAQRAVDDIDRQMQELKLAATESKEAKLAQTERIPAQPQAPEMAAIPGAAPASDVGQTFKGDVLPGAREALYGESSARYDALRKAGEQIPLPESALGEIDSTITKLAGESRLPKQAGTVAEQVKLGAEPVQGNPLQLEGRSGFDAIQQAGNTWRNLDPSNIDALIAKGLTGTDLMKAVAEGLTGEGATMANAMRADQILSAAERSFARSGDIAARAAAKELRQPILKALEESPLAEGLATAKSLHRETSELVGPRSLAERVFKTKPEQVVDNIFLPEGRGNPNTSIIKDAKAIYEKVAPGEWPKVTGAALAKLQERSIGATGQIDPQRFMRNWKSYRSTFESALGKDSFDAVDGLAKQVQQFNQSSRLYKQQLQLAQSEAKGMRDWYARQASQFSVENAKLGVQRSQAMQGVKAIEDQIHDANKMVQKLQEDLARTQTFGMKGASGTQMAMQAAMSPHMMIAMAQLGQAAQAMFTGNYSGAGRQFAQGVVWATLGNPMWLMRVAQNPQLAKAVNVALMAQKGSRVGIDSARLLTAATKAMGDEIYAESEPR